MYRQISDSNLSTRAARGDLKTRSKPYWRLIDHGRHIGYRRTARGGAWVARRHLGSGKYADTRMVERHYGHLVQSFKDRMIEEHAPKFGIADEINVIGLNQKN